jgi:hypothetical protein
MVPYVPYERLWREADGIRGSHWPSGTVPVDVEKILWGVKLDLVPLPSLKEDGDVDALLLGNLTTIVIDKREYMDDRMQNRIRFSIAHELGHFILHADIFRGIAHSGIEEWIDFTQHAPEEQYERLEFQANEFAGRLLVPVDRLKTELESARTEANKAGFRAWDQSGGAAKECIATRLSRIFGVSSQVIERRFDREKLWPAA